MDDAAIRVRNVSKAFKLPHEKHGSVKSLFVNLFRGRTTYEQQQVLDDVSFEVKKGEFFGIVGRNGSGKSTLLKLLAGIYSPNGGSLQVNGKLTPFIELGVGFNPELTGRENVFLNGALFGFSRQEMKEMYDEIVEFAELERFMDQKLKNYSSGMQVRLAFSIAIKADSDILVLDEVLAVGDSAFQKKCNNYFEQLKLNKKTVILVTHSMEAVEGFCDRAMLLSESKIKRIGTPSEIAQLYSDLNIIQASQKNKKASEIKSHKDYGIKASVDLRDSDNHKLTMLEPKKNLKIIAKVTAQKDIQKVACGLSIFNSQDIPIFATNTHQIGESINISHKEGNILEFEIDNIFSNDAYRIALSIKNIERTEIYYSNVNIADFVSKGRKHAYAVASPDYKFKFEKKRS